MADGHRLNGHDESPGDSDSQSGTEVAPYQMIHYYSSTAFDLAQRAASTDEDRGELKNKARELNDCLTDALPLIEGAPSEERHDLVQAWNDARLDIGYVLSDGELPTSTRLFYFLQDLESQAE